MSDTKRRRHLRAKIKGTITVHDSQGDISFETFDISQGGSFIHSSILLEEGEEVDISFALPNCKDPITTKAVVVRGTKAKGDVDTAGMALEFVGLTSEDKRKISEYVVQVLNASF